MNTSYRPHTQGYDYYEAGAYLITLVVQERERILSQLNDDPKQPTVNLTDVGRIVHEEWQKTEAIQCSRGRLIETACQVCMPDHWHGVIVVKERMDKSLGFIIQSFKSACTARWRREVTGYADSPSLAKQLNKISKEKRHKYYLTRPRIERPLFDDDYDDTICLSPEHLLRMTAYVDDNPRRAIVRLLFPHFMQRCLHVVIDGVDYAAFGNLFLLRWARKEQVFCHRRARYGQLTAEERLEHGYTYACLPDVETRIPYETTAAFRQEHDGWLSHVMEGATVLVTPGISAGERQMKQECLERGLPLIHLQKEPIGPFWKPELSRFEACQRGMLLILAPWNAGEMGEVRGVPAQTAYSRFHNLNTLARQICLFEGEARIVRMGG